MKSAKIPGDSPENPESPADNPWAVLRHFLHAAFVMFGGPEAIARMRMLAAKEHARMLAWLRPLEELLRKLIYLDALQLDAGPPASSRHIVAGKLPALQEKRFVTHDPDNPEAWRVSFHLMDRRRPRRQRKSPTRRRSSKLARDFRYDFFDPTIPPPTLSVSSPVYGGSVGRVAHDEGGTPRPLSHAASLRDSSPANGGAKLYSAWPIAERFEALIRAFNNPAPLARRLARALRRTPDRARAFTAMTRRPTNAPAAQIIAQVTRAAGAPPKPFPDSS